MNIFYSWQSDLTYKYNRNFIEDCLKGAIKKFNQNHNITSFSPARADKDTAGLSGSPNITDTIFQKIEQSSAFIGDISYISNSAQKKVPNPNVMIEMGYALSCLGDSKVINVMNTHYGDASELPFDLKHKRWPIQYSYSPQTPQGEKKTQKEYLINSIYDQLLLILVEKISSSNEEVPNLTKEPSIENIKLHILNSSSDDWYVSTIKNKLHAVYQKDVNLRLEINMNKYHLKEFREEWLDNYPKPEACSYWCNVIYCQSIVDRLIIVNANEGTLIPAPKEIRKATFQISNLDFKIGHIFNQSNTLMKDIRTAKINIELPIFKESGIIIG